MSTRRPDSAIGRFTAILEARVQTDGELLERYIRQKDEAAFATLVRRQGPMVFGVCRRVLGNEHDAEDAFQATFLVLARKASTVRPRRRVANWLYEVAYRTAQEARRAAARRRAREAKAVPRGEASQQARDELREMLDQELARLPDRYREVVVLCDLQGQARKDVARLLSCPEGTVASRLARARALLAARLTRRGLAFSGGSVAAMLAQNSASAGVPATLVSATVKAASLFAAGQGAAATLISAPVFSLTEKVIKAMFLVKLKVLAALVLLVGTLGSGAGWLYYHATAAQPDPRRVSTSPAGGPGETKEAAARKEIVLLKRELQEALERVAALEAKLAAKPEARAVVLLKAKPASYWIKQLQDRSPDYRREAVKALGGIGEVDHSVIPILVASLQDRDDAICHDAQDAIFGVGKEAIPSLITALTDARQRNRINVIRALTQFGEDAKAAVPALIRLMKAADRLDGLTAVQALGTFRQEATATVPALIPLLKDPTKEDCYVAIKAIGQIGPGAKSAVPALIELLREKKPVPSPRSFIRIPRPLVLIPAEEAAYALGKIGPSAKAAVPALLELHKSLREPSPDSLPNPLADTVLGAIERIDPMAIEPGPKGGRTQKKAGGFRGQK